MAVAVEDHEAGEAGTLEGGEGLAPGIEEDGEGELFGAEEFGRLAALLFEARGLLQRVDGEDLDGEPRALGPGRELGGMLQRGPAGDAPGRPEVQDDDRARQIEGLLRAAGEGWQGDLRRGATQVVAGRLEGWQGGHRGPAGEVRHLEGVARI